jgi:hypothetical protein
MKQSQFTERQFISALKENQNSELKKMYAKMALVNNALKDLIEKKL